MKVKVIEDYFCPFCGGNRFAEVEGKYVCLLCLVITEVDIGTRRVVVDRSTLANREGSFFDVANNTLKKLVPNGKTI